MAEEDRIVIGKVSEPLLREFKEASAKRHAIRGLMDHLLEAQEEAVKQSMECWKRAKEEVPKMKDLDKISFQLDSDTNEVYYSKDAGTYKERYNQLLKLIMD